MLTKRQVEILKFINRYLLEKKYLPSFEEIRKHLKLSSVSTVHFHVAKLRKAGYLRKTKNKARAIQPRLAEKNQSLLILRDGCGQEILSESLSDYKKSKKLPLNRILCGNAVNIMQKFPSNSIDLVVTSPPYDELRHYKGYNFNFDGIAINLLRVIKQGGVLVWVVGDKIRRGNKSLTSFRQALFFQQLGFNVHDVMIYKKKNTPFMRTNGYTNCFEFMFVFSKGSPKTFNPLKVKTARQGYEMLPFNKGPDGVNKKILGKLKPEKTMTNIWEYAVGLHGTTSDKIAFEHPAVFPEKLAEDHILSWTNQKDVVFDPMCGSGTTCKMALKNNRSYIGCDISKDYVRLSKERIKGFNPLI